MTADARWLDVAIVSFHSDGRALADTLDALRRASGRLFEATGIRVAAVLVDNSENGADADRLRGLVARGGDAPAGMSLRVLEAGRNLGYGAGNNLALRTGPGERSDADLVLVLNPDVRLQDDALVRAVSRLGAHPDATLLVPRALDPDGHDLHLAHRYPDPLVFALRGGAPGWLRQRQRQRLERYEIRDRAPDDAHCETVCASGCFLLLPRWAWHRIGGFDDAYFLYFEDYDLSCRALALGPILYAPDVRIVHTGGGAAGKGWRHRRLFLQSARRFFSTHGWSPSQWARRHGGAEA